VDSVDIKNRIDRTGVKRLSDLLKTTPPSLWVLGITLGCPQERLFVHRVPIGYHEVVHKPKKTEAFYESPG